MKFVTYREKLSEMTLTSSFIVMMYKVMKKVTVDTCKVKGYLNYFSRDKNPHDPIDIIYVLGHYIEDNLEILDDKSRNNYELLIRYFMLIEQNLDSYIRELEHVDYSDSEDESEHDEMINCDMINECIKIMNDILAMPSIV